MRGAWCVVRGGDLHPKLSVQCKTGHPRPNVVIAAIDERCSSRSLRRCATIAHALALASQIVMRPAQLGIFLSFANES